MQARMKNPVMILDNAMQSILGLNQAVARSGFPERTAKLVHLRVSQINGCSLCVDMHARELEKSGESTQRLFAVGAWRDAPFFSDAERAALALAEAETRLSDRSDPVPDNVWKEAAQYYDEKALAGLVMSVALINTWNRLNVTTRQVAGEWAQSEEARKWMEKNLPAEKIPA